MEFRHVQLDNGLEIVAELNDRAASMAAGFFVRTGSRDETTDVAGVSHFLEHMVFKGTERRTVFDVNREFDRMGADYNAQTSEENTIYFGAVLPKFQEKLLDLLCDILRPSLRDEDFDVEKEVILDEIAVYEDLPNFRVYDRLMAEHFSPHPLGRPILGTRESIRQLESRQMGGYFDRRYSPGNIAVVATGNLNFDSLVASVSQRCGHWPSCPTPRDTSHIAAAATTTVICDEKVAREHIGLMSAGPSHQAAERFAAELLAAVIGDSTGSRLYYALVEPAIADEAAMSFMPMDSAGAFITFVSAEADRAAQAIRIVREELRKILDGGVSEDELQAAKSKIASGATLRGELPMGRLSAVGLDWIYRRDYTPLSQQIDALFAVSGQQVHELAKQFDVTRTTTVALGPAERL